VDKDVINMLVEQGDGAGETDDLWPRSNDSEDF
jgi:hypothetical protein